MNNRKTLIALSITLFSFTVFADCKTDLHQANHLLSQGAEINDALKTKLKSCIKTLNDCDQYSYRDNCQHIYAKINTVSLPTRLPRTEQTSVSAPPTLQSTTPIHNSQSITSQPQNNMQPANGATTESITSQPQNNTPPVNGTPVSPTQPTKEPTTKPTTEHVQWY